jgi:hypothetical protein
LGLVSAAALGLCLPGFNTAVASVMAFTCHSSLLVACAGGAGAVPRHARHAVPRQQVPALANGCTKFHSENNPPTWRTCMFLACRWLDKNQGDGQTYATLYPSGSANKAGTPHHYRIEVYTSDIRGAGTVSFFLDASHTQC